MNKYRITALNDAPARRRDLLELTDTTPAHVVVIIAPNAQIALELAAALRGFTARTTFAERVTGWQHGDGPALELEDAIAAITSSILARLELDASDAQQRAPSPPERFCVECGRPNGSVGTVHVDRLFLLSYCPDCRPRLQ